MGQVIVGVVPFLVAQTMVLFLLVMFPGITLQPLRWLRGQIDFIDLITMLVTWPWQAIFGS